MQRDVDEYPFSAHVFIQFMQSPLSFYPLSATPYSICHTIPNNQSIEPSPNPQLAPWPWPVSTLEDYHQ